MTLKSIIPPTTTTKHQIDVGTIDAEVGKTGIYSVFYTHTPTHGSFKIQITDIYPQIGAVFKKNRHLLVVSKIPVFKIKPTLKYIVGAILKNQTEPTASYPLAPVLILSRGPQECNPLSLSRNSHCAFPLATLSFPLTRDSLSPSPPHARTPMAWRDRPDPTPLFLTVASLFLTVACPAAPPFPPVAGSAGSGATPQSGVASGLPW